MATIITGKVTGDKEALAAIEQLKGTIGRRILRKSINAAAAPMRTQLRSMVPRDTGLLKKRIVSKLTSNAAEGKFQATIGARQQKDPKTGRSASRYFHLVDKGFKAHKQEAKQLGGLSRSMRFVRSDGVVMYRRTIQHPGFRGYDLTGRAFRAAVNASTRAFIAKSRTEIDNEARKLAAKVKKNG